MSLVSDQLFQLLQWLGMCWRSWVWWTNTRNWRRNIPHQNGNIDTCRSCYGHCKTIPMGLYSGNFWKDVVGSTHRSLEIFSLTFFAFFPLYVGVNSSFMSETTSRKNDLLTLHGHVQWQILPNTFLSVKT